MKSIAAVFLLGFVFLAEAQLRASHPQHDAGSNSTLSAVLSSERRLNDIERTAAPRSLMATDVSGPKTRYVGNNGKPSNNFPLGLCEGDCDEDEDCRGNLVCQQRGPRDIVRGCSGGTRDKSRTDYCVLPDGAVFEPTSPTPGPPTGPPPTAPTPSGSTSDAFRLKLYWEKGYFWQEETRERKWCAMYNYDGLPGNGKCWYGRKRLSCRNDQVYITKCKDESRQYFKFIKLNGGEVLITLGDNSNRCFERKNSQIYLRSCDESEKLQRWYAPRGDFNGDRFEVSQAGYSKCMTQAHHPKAGEVVELHSCSKARSKEHETSYWNRY